MTRIYEGRDGTIDAEDDGVVLRQESVIHGVPRTNFRASDATFGYDAAGFFAYPDEATCRAVVAAYTAAGGEYDERSKEFFELTRGMGVLWLKP